MVDRFRQKRALLWDLEKISPGSGSLQISNLQPVTAQIAPRPALLSPHPAVFAGGSLQRMATSTSRAAGKLTASLVATAACLPQSTAAPPHFPPDHSIRREQRSRRLSSSPGFPSVSSRVKEIDVENGSPGVDTMPAAAAGGASGPRAVAAVVESQAEKRSDEPSSGTFRPDDATIGANSEARTRGGAGGGTYGKQEDSMPLPHCRERSSGQIRGGELM